MSLLSQKHLQNEEDAYKWVEARIWPNGAQCPHCFEQKRVSKMEGKATRFGLYKCYACRKQFRVTQKKHKGANRCCGLHPVLRFRQPLARCGNTIASHTHHSV